MASPFMPRSPSSSSPATDAIGRPLSQRLQDWVARILSREWIAVALGALLGAAGYGLVRTGFSLAAVLPVLVVAAALVAGGLTHLVRLARARRRFPPRGRLVDVAGTRIHLVAEGDAAGALPVVWFGGGHSAGAAMDHMHRVFRGETRSILIDRPGTGWSGTGAFPRTTAREAEEMVAALDRAGEQGPFVLAGHSFGGLLAANIARRYPERVARLVLLDATPLETLVFGPRLAAIRDMRRDALGTALLRLLGFRADLQRRRLLAGPAGRAAIEDHETRLGEALVASKGIDVGAGARLAEWSIYRELLGPHIGTCGWETVVYDGDLGDMPVWVVAPRSAEEVAADPQIGQAGGEATRMVNFFARSRERYLATSSQSRRIFAPPGATHNFVYEHPDFLIETMREAVRRGS